METNFFQQVTALQVKGDLNITIRQATENMIIVSILLNNDGCGDDARKVIPPIILKGTAAELDEGFFPSVSAPLQATSALFINMEAYMKQQEQAAVKSKMEKAGSDKATKEKTDKEKKLEAVLKQASELEAAGKYREAWIKIPEPTDYPEHSEMLRERREALSAQFAPSLFND